MKISLQTYLHSGALQDDPHALLPTVGAGSDQRGEEVVGGVGVI